MTLYKRENKMKYQVLLYYKYTTIEDPFAKSICFCKSLNLKGRILVATEGINGTLSGTVEETEKVHGSNAKQMSALRIHSLKLIQQKKWRSAKCLFAHVLN